MNVFGNSNSRCLMVLITVQHLTSFSSIHTVFAIPPVWGHDFPWRAFPSVPAAPLYSLPHWSLSASSNRCHQAVLQVLCSCLALLLSLPRGSIGRRHQGRQPG